MVVGLLRVEMHLPGARSLKEKRSVIKSLKDQLRGRFNVAVAEIAPSEKWQRATVGVTTLAEERLRVEALLKDVAEWIRGTRLVELIRVDEDYLHAG